MDTFIIGSACTHFGKHPNKSFKQLTREAFEAVINDARLDDGDAIESIYFANVKMDMVEQSNIRGQVCFMDLVHEKKVPDRTPIINVEGACASGSLALHGAWKEILAGGKLSLAIGVEKTFIPEDAERQYKLFTGGEDRLNPEQWDDYFTEIGKRIGKPWGRNAGGGTLNMDTYAMQAAYHMTKYGTTQRQFAAAASKDHHHGSLNPLAQYRFEASIDEVLQDRLISYPLTRAMCAPIGDGAAAALVCSADFLAGLPRAVQERAVKIRACALGGGRYRDPDEMSNSHVTARRAYNMAGVVPDDIDLAELHDARSYGEIHQAEMLGFCEVGKGGDFVESGASSLGGKLPINVSGGLVSKGHPVGATGLSMIYELSLQLRDEAGSRQVEGAQAG